MEIKDVFFFFSFFFSFSLFVSHNVCYGGGPATRHPYPFHNLLVTAAMYCGLLGRDGGNGTALGWVLVPGWARMGPISGTIMERGGGCGTEVINQISWGLVPKRQVAL